jgi:hypothetical protein
MVLDLVHEVIIVKDKEDSRDYSNDKELASKRN